MKLAFLWNSPDKAVAFFGLSLIIGSVTQINPLLGIHTALTRAAILVLRERLR